MKILYFYPENPVDFSQGNNSRCYQFLKYFKNRAIDIDFVGIKSVKFDEKHANQIVQKQLAKKVVLLSEYNRRKRKLHYFLFQSLPNLMGLKCTEFDRTRGTHQKEFQALLHQNTYDIVLISYAYWATLLTQKALPKNTKFILDTHDFLTSQFQKGKRFKLGRFFEKEIAILQKFDQVLVISNEEKYVFSQFISKPVAIATHALAANFNRSAEKKYDLLFVGSENSHNVNGINWFFNQVYPILKTSVRIAIVGKVVHKVESYSNVTKMAFVENLEPVYQESQIVICPLLSGTGLKIKVVEALSFGLPIVCTERGTDGLINKTHNGCLVSNNPHEFANYITKLMHDAGFYAHTAAEAKHYFTENHDIKAVYHQLDLIF